jgi:peptidoglycan-associated lipoprotein
MGRKMAKLNAFWYAVIIVISLSFVACSKTAAPTGPGATGPGTRGTGQPGPNGGTGSGDLGTGGGSLSEAGKGQSTETPRSSPLQEVYFGFDSFDLSNEARATLKRNADWLKANQSVRVEIEGHCDDRGTNEYNLALGAKRAQAAKDYLVSLGIPSDRLSTISYGEELPVCREETEDCWQKNRRARFVVATGRPSS